MRVLYVVSSMAALLLAGCGRYAVEDTLYNRTTTIELTSSIVSPFGANGVATHQQAATRPYDLQVTRAGIRWSRETLAWDSIEPKFRERDWTEADHVVERTKAFGLDLLPVLGRCATWARDDVTTGADNKTIQPPNVIHWGRHVKAIVGRYKDRVRFWEIWERPDDPDYFEGSPEDYVRLLKAAYTQARTADRDSVILMGTVTDPAWFESALAFGAGKHCDIVSVALTSELPEPAQAPPAEQGEDEAAAENDAATDEPEPGEDTTPAAPGGPEREEEQPPAAAPKPFDEAAELAAVRDQLDRFAAALKKHRVRKPVWVTSAGAVPAPAEAQAGFVVKLHATAMAHGADCLFWQEIVSERDGGIAEGLLYPDLSRRPAAKAYATLSKLLGYVTSCRVIAEDPNGLTAYEFRGLDELVLVVWSHAERTMPLPPGLKMIYDLYGEDRPLGEGEEKIGEVLVTRQPVFITTEIIEEPELSDEDDFGNVNP